MTLKAVILCGGKGTRLREETEYRPKPMVEVGNRPILWHIMSIYASYGVKDFIICLGYKGNMIKQYFLNYQIMNNDFTITLNNKNVIKYNDSRDEVDWTVTLADTGPETQTGGRIKKIEKYIDDDMFLLTYGDGVADININKLIEFHKSHGKIGTVTGVHPSSRFGELKIREDEVVKFHEKPQIDSGLVNGGFFAFNTEFFNYLEDDENCILEKQPLEALTSNKELMVYPHHGFWQCVDTYRELEQLNEMWKSLEAPWIVKNNNSRGISNICSIDSGRIKTF